MTFLSVSGDRPRVRVVTECEQVPVNVALDSTDDLETLRQGVAALRWSKIGHVIQEPEDPGPRSRSARLTGRSDGYPGLR